MCTVTYLPLKNDNFILTSNRDESPLRKTLFPKKYNDESVCLLYPKDELAGGTWIGISDKKRLVCLLNGGFIKHQRQSSYKKSRGVIVKELLKAKNSIEFIENYNFLDIEPFTIILIDWESSLNVFELVWDGDIKHFSKLPNQPKIWSSSPLYTNEIKKVRESWFKDWLSNNSTFTKESILHFHQRKDLGTKTTAPVMDRLFVKTISISCVEKNKMDLEFLYQDLEKNQISSIVF